MARKTIEHVTDDLDGSEGAEPVTFTIGGIAYEIDLGEKNAAAFGRAVEPYVKAARRAGQKAPAKKAPASDAPATRHARKAKLDLAAVRAWAVENGHKVSDRGRVPNAVVDAFRAAEKTVEKAVQSVAVPITAVLGDTVPADQSAPVAPRKSGARKAPAKKAAPRRSTARGPARKAASAEPAAAPIADTADT